MHNHGFTGQTQFRFTPVMETVHARDGSPDGVGVMPMRVEGMGAEECFEALYLRGMGRMFDPVPF